MSDVRSGDPSEPDIGSILARLIGEGAGAPNISETWTVPRSVGRYEVEEQLGVGGMGLVLRAHDPSLGRHVALKLLKPTGKLDDGQRQRARERLLREARAMAQVSHPNVVTIHDVGVVDGDVYLAMDLVEGPTLRAWLEQDRSWREILSLFIDAGRGLAEAHARGLVHRDFKPENVLVDGKGRAQVTDFGLVISTEDAPTIELSTGELVELKRLCHETRSRLTELGYLVGTPRYMAPEQFRGGPVDERADQFGFCVALYEALYRALPFDSPNGGAHDWRPRAPPANPAIPSEIWLVLEHGMSDLPAARWPSMTALLKPLEALLIGRGPTDSWRSHARFGLLGMLAGIGVVTVVFLSNPDRSCTPGEIDCECEEGECRDGARCVDGTCQSADEHPCRPGEPDCGACWVAVEPRVSNYTDPFDNDPHCACSERRPDCHELYQGRTRSIDGLRAKLEFKKVAGGRPSKTVRYWVMADEDSPRCTKLGDYAELSDGYWTPLDQTLVVENVPLWPSLEEFDAAPPGAQRRIFLATGDGAGDVDAKTWFQPEALVFTKVCVEHDHADGKADRRSGAKN